MDPFTRPESADVRDMLTDGAVSIIADRGLLGLSVSALARWSGMTPPALTQRFQGPHGSRRRIFHLITVTFSRRWLRWSTGALFYDDDEMLALPETDAERRGTRVWSALIELARGEEAAGYGDIAAVIQHATSEERAMIAARLGAGSASTAEGVLVCQTSLSGTFRRGPRVGSGRGRTRRPQRALLTC